MKPFTIARPRTLGEAVRLMEGGATAIAGGTDLLGLMKAGVADPRRLVDLSRLPDLAGWSRDATAGLRIGALTPLLELETSDALARALPILREAVATAATPQLRAMGTVGGNLLQRNRCWYFRDDAFTCWLKGGDRCFARDGENVQHAIIGAHECVMASPSDLAPALIAYDAEVDIRGPRATRRSALADLFVAPRDGDRREHSLRAGEALTQVRIAPRALQRRGVFIKQMDRKAWSFALVSVAVAARVRNGVLRDVRIVLGGIAPVPWRAGEAEARLEGLRADPRSVTEAAEAALADAEPLRENGYKVPVARELIRRAVLRLLV